MSSFHDATFENMLFERGEVPSRHPYGKELNADGVVDVLWREQYWRLSFAMVTIDPRYNEHLSNIERIDNYVHDC